MQDCASSFPRASALVAGLFDVRKPYFAVIDANIRYRLKLADRLALLCLQINNLTDRVDYSVLGNASLGFNSQRSFTVYLTVDV